MYVLGGFMAEFAVADDDGVILQRLKGQLIVERDELKERLQVVVAVVPLTGDVQE
ncbi:hypothetical protein GCM10022277_18360 [Litoribacillus peritrichatus]|uniref:Uncharacterized protein n=1 Tax=Litoribacillus peritrichatus TaxID=718191 RepID=A0ABP7MGQ0_9GAMM